MNRIVNVVVVIFLIGELHRSTGYQWLPLKFGDPIPEEAISIDSQYQTYVGRARHYNLVLPAEVYNNTGSYALISVCSEEIVKKQFEILVAMEKCEWKSFTSIADVPENVVRAGTAKTGEPSFIGKTKIMKNYETSTRWDSYERPRYGYVEEDSNFRIASILLSTNEVQEWNNNAQQVKFSLNCAENSDWTDTSADLIPSNTISGGKSENGEEIFVARLLNDCTVFSGQVIPNLGIASAVYRGKKMESPFCQVLVGDSEKYRWVSAKGGEIPDYAVVAGKYVKGELMYVARWNKTLGYILHKEARTFKASYEFLVKD